MFWLAKALCIRAQEAVDPANIRHPVKTDWNLIGVVATKAPAVMYVYAAMFFCHFASKGGNTVNPLYNDIRYNSKIRYNVNFCQHKHQRIVYIFIDRPMLFFRKTYVLDIVRIASPRRF